jgi:lipopolysaccharide heptosyltransferase I
VSTRTSPPQQTSMTSEYRSAIGATERLLVVRLSAMGDIIHAMPAIAALRRAKPDLQIGWLVEQRWAELLCARDAERLAAPSERKPLADWVHVARFSSWRRALLSRETWHEIQLCRREVRARKYQVALDLQGAIRSALAARSAGATVRIGASQPREAPARMFYTHAIDVRGAHVIEHALSLASEIAGQALDYVQPPFPVDPASEAWADQQSEKLGGKPLAILNPGAGWGAKCWPEESFGAVARALADRGMAALVNHGPGEEALTEAVRNASGGVAVPLKCSVGELIALTRRARLFIGGDTGPMQLAAALRVPVIALFGPTRPERNGPFGTPSVVLRSPQSVYNTTHTDRRDEGLVSIGPQVVIQAAERLLGEQHG